MHRQESENVIVPEARDEQLADQQWRIESGPGKGSVNHEKLLTLVGKQIADSRVFNRCWRRAMKNGDRNLRLHGELRKEESFRHC
jgi:hypothetical protein